MSTIIMNADNAVVNGTSDVDIIVVTGNNNTISGFGDSDTIFGVGHANLLYGDSTVQGGPDAGVGSDILIGGSGDDTLWGGADADTLQGGGGADKFSFGFVPQARLPVLDSTSQNPDLIVDFSQAEGDVINLSGLRLFPALPVIFLGTESFTDEIALEIRYEITGASTTVQFRVPESDDPSTPASLLGQINLAGNVDLTEDDFVTDLILDIPVDPETETSVDAGKEAEPGQATLNCAPVEHWLM